MSYAQFRPRRRVPACSRSRNSSGFGGFAVQAMLCSQRLNNGALGVHKCSIVSHKPDGKTLTMLGADGFKTKSEAESALKGMSECKA